MSNITDTSVQLKWTKPRRSYGNVHYIVQRHNKIENVISFQDFPEYIVKDLQPGTQYNFQVYNSGKNFTVNSKAITTKNANGKYNKYLNTKNYKGTN